MRLLLCVPPYVDMAAPLLAIPSLVSYLKKNGIDEKDISVVDLNVEFMEYLCDSDFLEKQADKVVRDFETLNARDKLDASAMTDYDNLYNLYIFSKIKLYKQMRRYLGMFHSEETFYDICKYTITIKGFFDNILKLVNYGNSLGLDYLFAIMTTGRLSEEDRVWTDFYQNYVIPQIDEITPEMIGFSIGYATQFYPTVYLAEMLREKFPDMIITMGGTHVTSLKQDLFDTDKDYFNYADFYVVGEGQAALLELLNALQNGRNFSAVPNLCYRNGDDVVANKLTEGLPLDDIPVPDFSCLPMKKYIAPTNVLPYRISRGCYWAICSFCSHFQTTHYSCKSAKVVVDHIKLLQRLYDTNFIYFTDDAIPRAFLEEFVALIKKDGIRINWLGNIRCEAFLTDEFVEKLAKSGCREIYFGIETGSQRLMKLMKKGASVNTCERVIASCHKHGISLKLNFIKNLPSETEEDIAGTIAFVRRTAKNCDTIALSSLVLERNTDLAMNPRNYGLNVTFPKDTQAGLLPFERTSGLTDLERTNMLYDQHTDLFARFAFLTRLHHFLYTVKFSREEFEHLSPRLFLLEESIEDYLTRETNGFFDKLSKTPTVNNNFHIEQFNYKLQDMKNATNGSLGASASLYIYSLSHFQALSEITPFVYQLLTSCDGVRSTQDIVDMFCAKYESIDSRKLKAQIEKDLTQLYKHKFIDFN